jgi:hypothetical protein
VKNPDAVNAICYKQCHKQQKWSNIATNYRPANKDESQPRGTKNDISHIQDKISANISDIISDQEEFEKKMKDKLDKQMKGIVTVVEQQKLHNRWTVSYKWSSETSK